MARELSLVSFVMQPPFDLDWALRTVSLGWYGRTDTLPVTVVDIDEATYRGWQSPAITPRGELARMIEVVTRAEPSVVIVDIDLSGRAGEAAADDEPAACGIAHGSIGARRRSSSRSAWNPATTMRVRQAASPYDGLFARNAKLHWAHASFMTDGDGSVRHWVEWLAVCSDRRRCGYPPYRSAW